MKTKRIAITITQDQEKMLSMLVGGVGTNLSDVVSKIVVMWLNDQKYIPEFVRKRMK
jgi:hypothetical protein|tara:strand:- start:119 stop:289 length:171 start_codon:yes stop_codon:yes gene_type:complete